MLLLGGLHFFTPLFGVAPFKRFKKRDENVQNWFFHETESEKCTLWWLEQYPQMALFSDFLEYYTVCLHHKCKVVVRITTFSKYIVVWNELGLFLYNYLFILELVLHIFFPSSRNIKIVFRFHALLSCRDMAEVG